MKSMKNIARIVLPMMLLFSCEEPETVVTNYVHPDGSVTRRIVMKSTEEKEIDPSDYRVPADSTWTITREMEIREQDTLWITTAEKTFPSVEEINRDYAAHQGSNKVLKRRAGFSRKFLWFNTSYRFTETVHRILGIELRVGDYLDPEELRYFYMPQKMTDSLLASADSLKHKTFRERADSAGEKYLWTAIVEEWVAEYLKLVPDSEFVNARKENILNYIDLFGEEDSVFIEVFGEQYYLENKPAIDTASAAVDKVLEIVLSTDFYTCEIVMPGQLVSTNGFADASGKVSWPVESDYYLAQDYVMWAESKEVNYWAWVVSAAFVVFVLAGLLVRRSWKRR